jgi:NodT family efflux transporter outer membrane factor (OMF) lipoprotein
MWVMTGCSHQGIQPRLQPVEASSVGLSDVQPAPVSDGLDTWWEACGDPRLAGLIAQALAGSPTIQVAQARLQRAQAQEMLVSGAELPQVQLTGQVDRQRFPEHGLYPPPVAGSTLTSGTLQLEGVWELDLFGKQRAEIAASIGQRRASEADLQAARLLLSSQVARQYVHLGRLQAQREVTLRALAQREEMLALIRQRVDAGLDTAVELRQGQGALPDTRQQVVMLDEQIALARHALAVLVGSAPSALDDLTVSLGGLRVPDAPQRLPLDLLARRADVMAARWRVESAKGMSEAARATFYPNIDLTSYAGYNAVGLAQVLKAGSLQWGLLPAIHLPLFDGDRRLGNLSARVSDQDAAVATYNQTVLQAMQETVDQLDAVRSVSRQQSEQRASQAHTESAYELAVQRYRAGLAGYLTVLSAESAVLSQRRQAVDLTARALDTRFSLIRAVGGRWHPAGHASPQQISPSQSGDRS